MTDVSKEFSVQLTAEDLPAGGVASALITEVWNQPMSAYGQEQKVPTWCLYTDAYPNLLLKVTDGVGKALCKACGTIAEQWVGKYISMRASTNPAPNGHLYIVVGAPITQPPQQVAQQPGPPEPQVPPQQ